MGNVRRFYSLKKTIRVIDKSVNKAENMSGDWLGKVYFVCSDIYILARSRPIEAHNVLNSLGRVEPIVRAID